MVLKLVDSNSQSTVAEQKVEKEKRKTIKELFANYDGNYEKQEIDWGEPQGKEIW